MTYRSTIAKLIAVVKKTQTVSILFKGQGAGIAAAVGIKTAKNTHEVAIDDVQEELKKQNVKFR